MKRRFSSEKSDLVAKTFIEKLDADSPRGCSPCPLGNHYDDILLYYATTSEIHARGKNSSEKHDSKNRRHKFFSSDECVARPAQHPSDSAIGWPNPAAFRVASSGPRPEQQPIALVR
jgi:hypothetical protein